MQPILNYLKTIQKAAVYTAHYLKQIADRDRYLSSIEDQLCDIYTLLADEPFLLKSEEYWQEQELTCATLYLPRLMDQNPDLDAATLASMAVEKGQLLAAALKQSYESKQHDLHSK
jgi:hypothetical protein